MKTIFLIGWLATLIVVLGLASGAYCAEESGTATLTSLATGSLLAAAWQRKSPKMKRNSSVRNRSRRQMASARRRTKT